MQQAARAANEKRIVHLLLRAPSIESAGNIFEIQIFQLGLKFKKPFVLLRSLHHP